MCTWFLVSLQCGCFKVECDWVGVPGGNARSDGRSGAAEEGARMGAEFGHTRLEVARMVPRGHPATARRRDRGKGR